MKTTGYGVLAVALLAFGGWLPAGAQIIPERQREAERRARRQAEEALKVITVDLDLQEVPLRDAVAMIASTAGVNIVLSPKADAALPVTLAVRGLSAWNVLSLLLSLSDLKMRYKFGVFLIGPDETTEDDVYTRIYDIRDLTFPIRDFPGDQLELPDGQGGGGGLIIVEPEEDRNAPTGDEIIDIIRTTTGERAWEGGKTALSMINGVLVVTHTDEMHARVAEILALLRAGK